MKYRETRWLTLEEAQHIVANTALWDESTIEQAEARIRQKEMWDREDDEDDVR